MRLSIIIPVLNEERTIAATVEDLARIEPCEIIVVDGGSTDRTAEIVRDGPARLVVSARGRAAQMNQGARSATGDVLLFLHADTRLPGTAAPDVQGCMADPACVGGRFDIRLDSSRPLLRIVGRMISLRSRLTRVATGDQAIFVRRTAFERLGGFPEIPIMEDVAFCRELKREGPIACLRSQVVSSARRWEQNGPVRTILLMWTLKLLYLAGVSPARLKRLYSEAR
ncbi:MAG: TIGR04283 family arsenosugar biosynthesis glycosyltransferase [Deltaproteobacteria bacterium]|nr:TIGR04283 family arsenosugar biosynthesis glycosyltransferase [Deltaproteobacteria bacterium]